MHRDVARRPGRGGLFSARGFTLVELMLTIAVAMILLSIGLPDFSRFVSDSRLDSAASQLHSLLALARTEAVRRGDQMHLCGSRDGQRCIGTAAGGRSRWTQALLFHDADRDRQPSAGEALTRVTWFDPVVELSWNSGDYLVYQGDGSVLGGSNGTFTLQPQRSDDTDGAVAADQPRIELVLSLSGRLRRR